MDAELKAKWVSALRSGKYLQATRCLRDSKGDNPSFCCLGVLLDVQGAEWLSDSSPRIDEVFAARDEGGWAADRFAGGLTFKQQEGLSGMNDNGSTFIQIADYIEREL